VKDEVEGGEEAIEDCRLRPSDRNPQAATCTLFDTNASGAGPYVQHVTASTNSPADIIASLIDPSLNRDGMVNLNAARSRVSVEIETGFLRKPDGDRTGTGFKIPSTFLLTFRSNSTATGVDAERTKDTGGANRSRSRGDVHITVACLAQRHTAAAGRSVKTAGDAVSANRAAPCSGAGIASDVGKGDAARSRACDDGALQTGHGQGAGTAL
jgi:hypothetical protein